MSQVIAPFRYPVTSNTERVQSRIRQVTAEQATRSVLFVCWSNLCRSPAGQSIMKRYLKRHRLMSTIRVDSAGVCLDENLPRASFAMRWTTMRRGYRLKRKARRVLRTDLNRFDLVIAMDRQNLDALRILHRSPQSRIRLLSHYLGEDFPVDVPDPQNRSRKTCHRVIDMLEAACPRIVAELLAPRGEFRMGARTNNIR